MGASGSTQVDFGAFPGASDASIAVTGQAAIVGGSLVEAWLMPLATADHSADEHIVDGPVVSAGNISAGQGFTIYAVARDGIPVPDRQKLLPAGAGTAGVGSVKLGDTAPMPYGKWTVAWAWI